MEPWLVWRDFLSELKLGPLSPARFHPLRSELLNPLQTVLGNLRPHLVDRQLAEPEVIVSGNRLHFIVPLGSSDPSDFCFTFRIENGGWMLQHIECIFIRMDQVGTLPVSSFPDLDEDQKAWARDEIRVSEMVRLYFFLAQEKGKEFALDWFHDGPGYLLGAQAWVPFASPSRAFILYVCWDLANLQNNPLTLLALDETKAVFRARLRYFEIYQRAVHISPQISLADYAELFRSIWQDRACCAGWDLDLAYEAETGDCTFTFTKIALETQSAGAGEPHAG